MYVYMYVYIIVYMKSNKHITHWMYFERRELKIEYFHIYLVFGFHLCILSNMHVIKHKIIAKIPPKHLEERGPWASWLA